MMAIRQPFFEWEETNKYFSGKHSIYCLKNQFIVTHKGLAVQIATNYKESVHDKIILDEIIDNFNENVVIILYWLTEIKSLLKKDIKMFNLNISLYL